MSGCAHMNPEDYCASCAPAKLAEARASLKVMSVVAVNLGESARVLREALVATDSLLSLVRHRHRKTPWPNDLMDDVDQVLAQSSAALAAAQPEGEKA